MGNNSLIFHPSYRRARAAFDLKFYLWARDQIHEEAGANFPTVKRIKNGLVYRLLEVAQKMDAEERTSLLNAFVKRGHPDGCELAGEELTATEQALIDRYVNWHSHEVLDGVRVLDAAFEWRDGQRVYSPLGQRTSGQDIARARLRAVAAESLQPIAGTIHDESSTNSFSCDKRIGDWLVQTQVTTNKRFAHLAYFQRISVEPGIDLRFPISVLQWFGIAGETEWKLQANSEIEGAVRSLASAVKQFLDAVPMLLCDVPRPSYE